MGFGVAGKRISREGERLDASKDLDSRSAGETKQVVGRRMGQIGGSRPVFVQDLGAVIRDLYKGRGRIRELANLEMECLLKLSKPAIDITSHACVDLHMHEGEKRAHQK